MNQISIPSQLDQSTTCLRNECLVVFCEGSSKVVTHVDRKSIFIDSCAGRAIGILFVKAGDDERLCEGLADSFWEAAIDSPITSQPPRLTPKTLS